MPDLTINGVDLASLGFVLARPGGWQDSPETTWDTAAMAGDLGVVVYNIRRNGRRISLIGDVEGASASVLNDYVDKLKWVAMKRVPADLVFGDQPTREAICRHEVTQMAPNGPAFAVHSRTLVQEWFMADPYFRDIAETQVTAITNTPKALPQGTGPCWPTIEITGPATTPLIELKDSAGNIIGSMTLASLAGGSNKHIIDMRLATIVNESGTNSIHLWTAGTFFQIESKHFDYVASSWPTLRCSSGTAVAKYRKNWL